MKNQVPSVIPSFTPAPEAVLHRFMRSLQSACGAAAVAVLLAACGGGNDQALTPEAQAQRDQAAAVVQAQQSATQLMSAVVQPGSGIETFEAGMGDWQNWGNAQVVAGAGTAASNALQVGMGSGGAALRVPVVAGTAYRLTAQVRVTNPDGPATMGIDFYNGTGRVSEAKSPNVTSTSFGALVVDGVAPATASYALVWVWKNGTTGYAYVDDVVFQPEPSAPPPPIAPPVNLLSNGGFEAGMTDWVDWGNTQVVSGTTNSGSSMLGVGPAAGGAGHEVGGIVPGTTYRMVTYAKVSGPSETAFVGVNFVDAAGSLVLNMQASTTSLSWDTLSVDAVAPPGAVKAVVYVWKNAGAAHAYVDDFAFGVAPGSSPPPPPPPPTGNLVVNGGFENGLANWGNWGNAVASTGQAAAGAAAAQVGTGAGGIGQAVSAIVPGSSYRASALVKVSSPDELAYFGLKFLDGAGTTLQDALVPFPSTAYSSAQVDLVAPVNAASAMVYVWKNAGSGYAFIDEVTLVQVTGATGPGLLQPGAFAAFAPANLSPDLDNGGTRGVISAARLAGGGSVVAWSTGTSVLVQQLDVAGSPVGAPQTAGGILPRDFSVTNGLSVAATADGGWLVAWIAADRTPVFRRYDASGAPVAGPSPIDATPFTSVTGIHATGLADGGFIAAWVAGEGTNPRHAFLRRFGPTGAAATDRVVLGDSAGAQTSAQVTPVPDGSFVAAWVQANPDGTDSLLARRLDAGLQSAGADLVLQPAATFHPYNFVAAASRSQGAVVVAWGYDSAGTVQARWQLLDVSGAAMLPVGTPGSTNSITASRIMDSVVAIPSTTGFRVVAESTFGFSRGATGYTTIADVGPLGERLANTETTRTLATVSEVSPTGCTGTSLAPGVAAAGGEDGHYLLAYATCPAVTSGFVKPYLEGVGH